MSFDFFLGMLTMMVLYRPILSIWKWMRNIYNFRKAVKQFEGESRIVAKTKAGEWRDD